jgi:ribosomal protein S2
MDKLLTMKYNLRLHDKKIMSGITESMFHKGRFPYLGIVPNIIEGYVTIHDFLKGRVSCVGVVDSNVSSEEITIPLPGNDDSILCINFYLHIFTKKIFSQKVSNIII